MAQRMDVSMYTHLASDRHKHYSITIALNPEGGKNLPGGVISGVRTFSALVAPAIRNLVNALDANYLKPYWGYYRLDLGTHVLYIQGKPEPVGYVSGQNLRVLQGDDSRGLSEAVVFMLRSCGLSEENATKGSNEFLQRYRESRGLE